MTDVQVTSIRYQIQYPGLIPRPLPCLGRVVRARHDYPGTPVLPHPGYTRPGRTVYMVYGWTGGPVVKLVVGL